MQSIQNLQHISQEILHWSNSQCHSYSKRYKAMWSRPDLCRNLTSFLWHLKSHPFVTLFYFCRLSQEALVFMVPLELQKPERPLFVWWCPSLAWHSSFIWQKLRPLFVWWRRFFVWHPDFIWQKLRPPFVCGGVPFYMRSIFYMAKVASCSL